MLTASKAALLLYKFQTNLSGFNLTEKEPKKHVSMSATLESIMQVFMGYYYDTLISLFVLITLRSIKIF